jgi:hypothetical protein
VRDLEPPFQFDLSGLIARMRRVSKAVDGISINLPFVSVSVKPKKLEQRVAREVVIRMADRRVLNASECCDSCIKHALASLLEIRKLLVDKQVELSGHSDGPLYLMFEAMAEAIRQFSTFEQRLGRGHEHRQKYFAALEMLRSHLYRVLRQVALIAAIEIPKIADHMRYDDDWQVEAYKKPDLPVADGNKTHG